MKAIQLAVAEAQDMAYNPAMKHRVACVLLDKRGAVLASATNSQRTHPMQAKWAKKAGTPSRLRLHAEIAALVKSRGEDCCTAVIARVNKMGEPMPSFPCAICLGALTHYGIRSIVYFNGAKWVTA